MPKDRMDLKADCAFRYIKMSVREFYNALRNPIVTEFIFDKSTAIMRSFQPHSRYLS